MNKAFDYNGTLVSTSRPVKQLKKVRYDVTIDSRDRDPTKFIKVVGGPSSSDPGDYTVYLPRVYENVCCIRLKSAIIQTPETGLTSGDLYFLMNIEGLNKIDETAASADRSGNINSAFAKIPIDGGSIAGATITAASSASSGSVYEITYTTSVVHGFSVGQLVTVTGLAPSGYNVANATIASVPSTTTFTVLVAANPGANSDSDGIASIVVPVYYNDSSQEENIHYYSPPIGRLDRMHITLRTHKPFSQITSTSPNFAPLTFGTSENTFRFEIICLENGFDEWSTTETRIGSREMTGFY
jgi:hypothetical protein